MEMEKYLMSLCKLYKGEDNNPFDEEKDEFKWYMWREEKKILAVYNRGYIQKIHKFTDTQSYKRYFDENIMSAIDMYIGYPFPEDKCMDLRNVYNQLK